SACQPGQYGRECEHRCNCAGNQSCFVSTGGCPSGCAAGFQGEDCGTQCLHFYWCKVGFRCDTGIYGLGCQSSCSQFCVRDNDTRTDFCDNTNGACLYGCQDGYQGPNCTKVDENDVVVVVVVAVVSLIVVISSIIVVILV
ncbi:unnamed protein product, partial [Candidula unifasciata]